MNTDKYIITKHTTIIDALFVLDKAAHDTMSLFVIDENQVMVGTVSDGDIRRGVLNGVRLEDSVEKLMHTNFKFVYENEIDIYSFKQLREKNILFIPILDREHHIISAINLRRYKSFLPIDAVLMAGGKGERLRPLTETTPKPLLQIGNKAIIDHNVDRLISYGVNHISVTVNYLKEQIIEHFSEPREEVTVNCYSEPCFLGTIGSIKYVEAIHNDTVLVMNSDLFTNIDYEDFYLHFKKHDADMSVAAVPYNVSIPYGVLDLEGRNIKGLIEKPKYNYYANAGIYLIKKSALDYIPKDIFYNATDLIETLISENKTVIRYPLNGTWIDIGTPQEYQRAKDLVKHI